MAAVRDARAARHAGPGSRVMSLPLPASPSGARLLCRRGCHSSSVRGRRPGAPRPGHVACRHAPCYTARIVNPESPLEACAAAFCPPRCPVRSSVSFTSAGTRVQV